MESIRQDSSSQVETFESKLLKLTHDYITRSEHNEILEAKLSAKISEERVKLRYGDQCEFHSP
jgi:hypothetical protein